MATSTSTVNPGTQRKDNWQMAPMLTLLGLGLFGVYALWRALMNGYFTVPGTQYLAPMYSPYLPEVFHTLGIHVPFLADSTGLGWIVSPALFILWAPLGFRTTCYYYRKAYYRSFFSSPAACAVGNPNPNPIFNLEKATLGSLLGKGKKYTGERCFPMVLQNLHRYFFYVAALFILILGYDAFAAFFLPGYSGIYIGLGTVIFVVNVVLLAMYTFGCHSWRHLLGGKVDCFSACGPVGDARHHAWQRQSILNEHHMLFAWLSLFSVWAADAYVFLVAKGVFADPHVAWTWQQIFGS